MQPEAVDIEELRRLVERVTRRPGYSSFVGTEVVSVEIGTVAMRLARRPELTQANGYFHGGIISGLADHTAGAAVTSTMAPGRYCLTVGLQVNFLAPADGDYLIAKATVLRSGTSISTAEIRAYAQRDDEETLCAAALATLRSIRMPAGAEKPVAAT